MELAGGQGQTLDLPELLLGIADLPDSGDVVKEAGLLTGDLPAAAAPTAWEWR